MNNNELTPPEALYGFIQYLTTVENPTVIAKMSEASWMKRVDEFCSVNNIPLPGGSIYFIASTSKCII